VVGKLTRKSKSKGINGKVLEKKDFSASLGTDFYYKNIRPSTVFDPVVHQTVCNEYFTRAHTGQWLADVAPSPEVHRTGLVPVS
jgi:hypothetical protein